MSNKPIKYTSNASSAQFSIPQGKLKSQRQLFNDEDADSQADTTSSSKQQSVVQQKVSKDKKENPPLPRPYQTPLTNKQAETKIQVYSEKKNQFNMTPKSKLYNELDNFKCTRLSDLQIKIASILRSYFASDKSIHNTDFRIYIEISELAKRNHFYSISNYLSQISIFLQPFSIDTWHCWARSLEELGYSKKAAQVLVESLKFIKYSDNTLSFITRLMEKIQEKKFVNSIFMGIISQGNFSQPQEHVWKVKVFQEWIKFLENQGETKTVDFLYEKLQKICASKSNSQSIMIVKNHQKFLIDFKDDLMSSLNSLKVLDQLNSSAATYSICFGVFLNSLLEGQKCTIGELLEEKSLISSFTSFDSSYKVSLSLAQFLSSRCMESNGDLTCAQQLALGAIQASPLAEKWKGIFLYCKIIAIRSLPSAIQLMNKFLGYFKENTKSGLMLSIFHVRLLLVKNDFKEAQEKGLRLAEIVSQYFSDWKSYFQVGLLLFHSNLVDKAHQLVKQAVMQFPTSGRLWALLIQLESCQDDGCENRFSNSYKLFQLAIKHVPKSGEVWCEGAKIYMNPDQNVHSLREAMKCIDYALKLTPQYGDTYLEAIKLCSLQQNLKNRSKLKSQFLAACPTYGHVWHYMKDHDYVSQRQSVSPSIIIRVIWKSIKKITENTVPHIIRSIQQKDFSISLEKKTVFDQRQEILHLTAVPKYNKFLLKEGQKFGLLDKMQFFCNNDLLLAV